MGILTPNEPEPYDHHVEAYRERQRLAWIDKRNREALRNAERHVRHARNYGMDPLRAYHQAGERHLVAVHGDK